MKNYNALGIILLSAALIGGCESKKPEDFFSFDSSKLKKQYLSGETVNLAIVNANNKAIDSIVYYANDQKLTSKKDGEAFNYEIKSPKLGLQNLKALVYYDGETGGQEVFSKFEVITNIKPKVLKYTIVNTYPHDIKSFTEGLEFFRDTLYESTGQEGASYLRKYDYKTGKVYKQTDLDAQYFGEGITVIGNKIYQLTWRNKTGFIYNADTWKLEKTFTFDKEIEGWGMTHDDKYIYQSDGTEKVWRMDPATQKLLDFINIYIGDTKIPQVNELELAEGKLYANVWQKDAIAVINPESGATEGIIDFAGLRAVLKVTKDDVLNGIAYNPKTKTFFITGKNWDKMFEVKFSE
ncbi:MAG: glutaminyl-peptide cyclotransferase [Flavobacterium sp.]|nr:glutaminyl-peptide cyclotransferase [Flavobacterium sp.]